VPGDPVRIPAFDVGFVNVDRFSTIDDYIRLRKSLRKKINAFRNKGGEVDVIRGALGKGDRDAIDTMYRTMEFPILTPYQDIFPPLCLQSAAIDHPNILHLVTRMNGEPVGYHSYHVGHQTLHCLSGGFDRTRKSIYHAYENLIIESVRFCIDEGIPLINYGPAFNDTKPQLTTAFQTLEVRTHVRYGVMKTPMAKLLQRSHLSSERIAQYREMGDAESRLN